ncbi:ABC transporter substrate-binding protein [Erwinia endophytica]|uniref:ABC transporter substrate-binding protein n=1 Tax=Erwinia endophytica TaxID=1563158 RepID=UPI001265EE0A|nr:ABC transporter substrate-binding protein [Erwinia endophytica]KAB8313703.1 ABC transporter substrate-binding protein [Erwinia endophytica]
MARLQVKYPNVLAACTVVVSLLLPLSATADEMTFASWGGAYQDGIRAAWIKPFTQETGIQVVEDTNPLIARIKAMVDTHNVQWDVVTAGGASLMQGAKSGLFEKITPDKVDESNVLPAARNDYGVPSEIFSTVIGYSTKAFPNGGPKTFADFWNVKKFPGKRTLPDKPDTVLEAALLADGVAPADVYKTLDTPAGMKRALDKIRQIRPYVAMWWSSGAQPVQALGSGDVVMALGWNGRFQAGIDDGLPIAMSWGQSVAQVGYFMIVKGAPDKAQAVKFLNYIIRPEVQARFSKYVAYGPVTPKSIPLIDKSRLDRLPSTPERLSNALFMNIDWWAAHSLAAGEAYNTAMQQ